MEILTEQTAVRLAEAIERLTNVIEQQHGCGMPVNYGVSAATATAIIMGPDEVIAMNKRARVAARKQPVRKVKNVRP